MNGKTVYFLRELGESGYTLLRDITSGEVKLHAVKQRLKEILMLCNMARKEMDMDEERVKYPL